MNVMQEREAIQPGRREETVLLNKMRGKPPITAATGNRNSLIYLKIRKRFSRLGQMWIERATSTHRDFIESEDARHFNNLSILNSSNQEDKIGKL